MYTPTETRRRPSGSYPSGAFDAPYPDPYMSSPQQTMYSGGWEGGASFSAGYGVPAPSGNLYPQMNQPQTNSWNVPDPSAFPGGVADFLQSPVLTGAAAHYGKELVDTQLGKYRDKVYPVFEGPSYFHQHECSERMRLAKLSTLKYYFAVDTNYVVRKLGLLMFPFHHGNWEVQYLEGEPVQPRLDTNAPDLYIPLMAFVTYICVAGYALGAKDKFDPEQLGIHASSALIWLIAEVLLLMLIIYLTQMPTVLKYYDLVAYCGYKYVGMIIATMNGNFFGSVAYYGALVYLGGSLAYLVSRALRVQIMPQADDGARVGGNKRRFYFLCFASLIQPVLMWWQTSHLL